MAPGFSAEPLTAARRTRLIRFAGPGFPRAGGLLPSGVARRCRATRSRQKRMSVSSLPRILYLLAAIAWLLLLKSNPVTLFLAGCAACLSLPVYRHLRIVGRRWRAHFSPHRRGGWLYRGFFHMSRSMPVTLYACGIVISICTPIAVFVLLVSPQIAGGVARLRELQANNFQLPPDWVAHIQGLRANLAAYPRLERALNDALGQVDSLIGDTMGQLINRGLDLVGGTMSALWTLFLFMTLTVIFAMSARRINLVVARLFAIPVPMLKRFVLAIRRALRAILMGIVLVAAMQGVLCGIGFAVAGIRQPAFWGLLATLVAPIPAIGTALVWGPLCLSLWFSGSAMPAVGLALWGSLAVAGVDNVFRPLFLRQGIKAPFVVLIIAILCGLASFGPVGLIAGPVLLAFALQAVEEGNRLYHAPESTTV